MDERVIGVRNFFSLKKHLVISFNRFGLVLSEERLNHLAKHELSMIQKGVRVASFSKFKHTVECSLKSKLRTPFLVNASKNDQLNSADVLFTRV